MNTQKLPLIVGFNLVIAVADVILLSRGLLSFTGSMRLIILLVSIVIFIVGNYILLSIAFKKPDLKNKKNVDADDFERALKGWKGMNTPYGKHIDMAIKQLEQLESRKEKLKALSDDTTFDSAIEEVEANIFRNFNRIINRFLIYDKNDNNDINRNGNYIMGVLQTNERYLDVFRKFINEIAMIGDLNDNEGTTLSLQTITESLRDIRMNSNNDPFDD